MLVRRQATRWPIPRAGESGDWRAGVVRPARAAVGWPLAEAREPVRQRPACETDTRGLPALPTQGRPRSPRKEVHVVLDNLSTHDTPEVRVDGGYTWHDKIDPNPQYSTDRWKSTLAEIITLGQADPYDIHITHHAPTNVILDKATSWT